VVLIRRTTNADLDALVDVLESAGLNFHEMDYMAGWPYESTFIAEIDGEPVGIVEGRFDAGQFPGAAFADAPAPRAWIDTLGVIPAAQHHGIGRRLINTFAAEAQRAGCNHVGLTVDETTDPTARKAFFRRCGFEYLDDPEYPEANMAATITTVVHETT
jgi:GNAT superfamily N-acetyltransferase